MRFYLGMHRLARCFPLSLRGIPVCISANVLGDRIMDQHIVPFAGAADADEEHGPGGSHWLLDSGAFTQIEKHGSFQTSPEDYAHLLRRISSSCRPDAAVTQDMMCETFILDKTGLTVADHQRITVERYDAINACGTGSVYLMPVLQGWTPRDYQRCVELYGDRLAPNAWVGVGSVCKRQGKPADVLCILRAIKQVRPDLRLHGFGTKTTSLRHPEVRALLHTADSMAWSFAARYEGRNGNDWKEALAFWEKVQHSALVSSDDLLAA